MKGTLLNTATVACGAGIGWAVGRYVPHSYEEVAVNGLGLVVCLIGAKMFFASKNAVIVVASIALGGVIGAALGIAPAMAAFAEWVRSHVGGGGNFNSTLITTSVLFCVGPMTLLGCLQDGIDGNIELLSVKSTLDGIAALFFAATLDPFGVFATAGVVLVLQGSITLAARRMQKFAKNEDLVGEATAAGGAVMVGIGLGLLDVKKMHMETYLPALVLAPAFSMLARKISSKKVQPA